MPCGVASFKVVTPKKEAAMYRCLVLPEVENGSAAPKDALFRGPVRYGFFWSYHAVFYLLFSFGYGMGAPSLKQPP